MDNSRLTDIEMKLAYLEDTVQTLNDVIIRQNSQVEQLSLKFETLKEAVESADTPEGDDQPPPHY